MTNIHKNKWKNATLNDKFIKEFSDVIGKLFRAYKKDERVIEEMAEYIDFDKMNFNCGMCVHDGCQKECIIDYFRKKCE